MNDTTTSGEYAISDDTAPRLTRRQAAIIGVFTGFTCGPFGDVQALGDLLMGHSTYTHEYADEAFTRELAARVRPLFLALCAEGDRS